MATSAPPYGRNDKRAEAPKNDKRPARTTLPQEAQPTPKIAKRPAKEPKKPPPENLFTDFL